MKDDIYLNIFHKTETKLSTDRNVKSDNIQNVKPDNEVAAVKNLKPRSRKGSRDVKEMTISKDEFWRSSNNDTIMIGELGKQDSKQTLFNKLDKTGAGSKLAEELKDIASEQQDRVNNDTERDRDPAVIMAAMHYRADHSLRNEDNGTKFSYW